jgi:hypothetical protein
MEKNKKRGVEAIRPFLTQRTQSPLRGIWYTLTATLFSALAVFSVFSVFSVSSVFRTLVDPSPSGRIHLATLLIMTF